MGQEYFKRGLFTANSTTQFAGSIGLQAGLNFPIESLTGTAANQSLAADGVSFLTVATSNLGNDFVLPNPPAVGAIKLVFVNFDTTSGDEFSLHAGGTVAGSSDAVFFGTTANTITGNAIGAGTIPVGGSPGLLLIGVTTSQWAATILGSTVLFNFTASTGSTSQN